MKILKYIFIFFLFINYAQAAKIDDYIKISPSKSGTESSKNFGCDILNEALKSAQNEIFNKLDKETQKIQGELNKNITNITGKFDNEIQKATDRINNNIIGKAEKLVDDATKEYNSIVGMKEQAFGIIANLPKYLRIAKIVAIIIVIGLLLLVISFIITFIKMKNLSKSLLNIKNFSNMAEINKKIKDIDTKLNNIITILNK